MTLAPPAPNHLTPTSTATRTRAQSAATRAHLRRLIAKIEARPTRPLRPQLSDQQHPESPEDFRDLLSTATRRETDSGLCTYREVRYPLSHEAGHQPLSDIRALSTTTLELLAPDEGLDTAAIRDLYFLDIETSGLGGAGAIAFLVATARFEVDADGAPLELVLSQYLAESPPEEAALLDALIADGRFQDDPVLVTYNGRTFDAPLLDERATMHRRRAGFDGLRQLDLLRPARTSYRSLLKNCKLATMEHQLLGMTRPSEDIPGAEVPHWYFRFLRTGDHRMLNPIIEHNELDVVGMVGLLAWHAAHLDSGREPSRRDALALGRLLVARGEDDRATPHLTHAAQPPEPPATLPARPHAPPGARTSPALPADTPLSDAPVSAHSGQPLYPPGLHRSSARPTPPAGPSAPPTAPSAPSAVRPRAVHAPLTLPPDRIPAPEGSASRGPAPRAGPRPNLLAHSAQTAYPPGPRRPSAAPEAPPIREEALIRLAALHKRHGDRDRAAGLWHEALRIPPRAPLEPLIELAMYYEHQRKDFTRAILHAEQAATHVSTHLTRHDPARATRWQKAINHRLTRLHSRAERARDTT